VGNDHLELDILSSGFVVIPIFGKCIKLPVSLFDRHQGSDRESSLKEMRVFALLNSLALVSDLFQLTRLFQVQKGVVDLVSTRVLTRVNEANLLENDLTCLDLSLDINHLIER
jgi:hypothetical protein